MDQREGSEYWRLVGIDGLRCQYCGSSAKNFDSLAAQSAWKQREKGEEERGFL
jgi:hypothetical protein